MKTLVLIPGLISDAIIWQNLANAMRGQLHIHNADITHDATIPDMAKHLLNKTDGELIVVGHSLGGRVAMEMAHIDPNRIAGLVLADTGYAPKKDGEETKRHQMIDLGHKSMQQLADLWLPPMLNPEVKPDHILYAKLNAMILRANANTHERQIRALIARPDAGKYLHKITCPTLLIVGRQDMWSPIAQHQEIFDKIENSLMVIIDNAGHFAPIEQVKATTNAITNWLQNI